MTTLAASSTGTPTAPSVATSTVVASPSPTTTPAFSPLSSTTSVYVPGITPLPGYKPGQLIFIGGGAPAPAAPPAPAPYVAKAVHFDPGSTVLFRSYLGATDSSGDFLLPNTYTGTYSVWFKTDDAGHIPEFLTTWYQNISNGNVSFFNGNSAIYLSALTTNLEMYRDGNSADYFANGSTIPSLAPDTWYHQASSWNTNFPKNEKLVQIYLSAAPVTLDSPPFDSTSGPVPVEWSGASVVPFPGYGEIVVLPDLPNDTSGGLPATPVDMADFQLWDGTFVDLSVPANLAKFISNGKPVDPAIAAAAFGKQTLLFSGDASTFGNNQGTGGAFNLAKPLFANARNGVGPISLPGAIAGQPVLMVIDSTNGSAGGDAGNFETTISVNDQIQQTSSVDLSGSSFIFYVPGTLINASTSPSN